MVGGQDVDGPMTAAGQMVMFCMSHNGHEQAGESAMAEHRSSCREAQWREYWWLGLQRTGPMGYLLLVAGETYSFVSQLKLGNKVQEETKVQVHAAFFHSARRSP